MASDDGFREFQLGGKHLVALFMFTTIVAVVIFLCGVMVGRGVRNNTSGAAAEAAAAPAPTGDVAAVPDVQAGPRSAAAAPATTPPPVPADDAAPEGRGASVKAGAPAAQPKSASPSVTQPASDPRGGTAKPASAAPAVSTAGAKPAATLPPATPGSAAKPAPGIPAAAGKTAATVPATAPRAGVAPGEPAGTGYVVQVSAVIDKLQAEAKARELLDKGYAAYVLPPAAAGGMFRVRIGKFKERREADAVVRRLKKEEQIDAWIPPIK